MSATRKAAAVAAALAATVTLSFATAQAASAGTRVTSAPTDVTDGTRVTGLENREY
jgi:hypothetical protein